MADTVVQFFNLFESAEEIPLIAAVFSILATAIRSSRTNYRRIASGIVHKFLRFHDRLRDRIIGEHPERRLWHTQWLSVTDVYRDLRRILPTLRGRVLDVGCSGKPYSRWLSGVDSHVGVDVKPGPTVDCLIRDGEPWPLESGSFQSVLCSQVLYTVRDVPHMVREIDRVLEVGGVAVITIPFVYHDMTAEFERESFQDFWRHTFHGAHELFGERFEVVDSRRQGGFGTTAGMLFLNWVHLSLSRSGWTYLLLALLFPVWLLVCLVINLTARLLDTLDRTDAFYHNVLLVVRKKALDPRNEGRT